MLSLLWLKGKPVLKPMVRKEVGVAYRGERKRHLPLIRLSDRFARSHSQLVVPIKSDCCPIFTMVSESVIIWK